MAEPGNYTREDLLEAHLRWALRHVRLRLDAEEAAWVPRGERYHRMAIIRHERKRLAVAESMLTEAAGEFSMACLGGRGGSHSHGGT